MLRWRDPRETTSRATSNNEVADASVIGTHTMHEQKNDLVEAKPDQKRYSCRNGCMPYVKPVILAPPLHYNAQDYQRHTEFSHGYHKSVEDFIASCGGIYPTCDGFIHRYILLC